MVLNSNKLHEKIHLPHQFNFRKIKQKKLIRIYLID